MMNTMVSDIRCIRVAELLCCFVFYLTHKFIISTIFQLPLSFCSMNTWPPPQRLPQFQSLYNIAESLVPLNRISRNLTKCELETIYSRYRKIKEIQNAKAFKDAENIIVGLSKKQ